MNFIEIGSNDYDTFLTSPYFTKNSWGIIAEPVKKYFDNLPRKENVVYLNQALTSHHDGEMKFYQPIENPSPEWVKSIGSLYPNHPTLEELGIRDQTFESTVQTISLSTLYDLIPLNKIHFLKLDTEGNDFDILSNWDFDRFQPMHVQFESKLMSKEQLATICEILHNNKYIVSEGGKKDYSQRCYNHVAVLEV